MFVGIMRVMRLQEPDHRGRFVLVVGISLVIGACEVVGVASVAPFIALAVDPGLLERNAALSTLQGLLGADASGFVVILGIAAFATLGATIVARMVGYHLLMRFVQFQSAELAAELLERYLAEPYERFLERRPADMAASLVSEVEEVATGAVLNAMRVVAYGLIALFLIGALLAVEPVAGMIVGGSLALAYGALYVFFRRGLRQLGRARVEGTRAAHRALLSALASAREAKLHGSERRLVAGYAAPVRRLAEIRTRMSLLDHAPRGGLEILTFGGMILFALWALADREGDLAAALPLLGFYAVAGMRLFPVLQRLFRAAAGFRATEPALGALEAEIAAHRARAIVPAPVEPLRAAREIRIEGGAFAFPRSGKRILDGIDLVIPVRERVGLVGPTGAGKSTTAEIVAGLLPLERGRLLVDGRPVGPAEARAWGLSIGYAPQSIELLPGTIAANIAFDGEQVSADRLRRVARIARVDAFARDLPQGFDTVIGAGGLRLSGGQAQRVGLARALYRDPSLLILDEATSALDAETEAEVLDAVFALEGTTILLIAHRMSAVRRCGLIYHLERGRVLDAGDFEAMTRRSPRFRALRGLAA